MIDTDLQTAIHDMAHEIEEERGITFAAIRLVGSEQMGIAHDNSDVDLNAIYAFDQWKYPAQGHSRETIDTEWDKHDIDLHGWNIDKFGQMVSQSNPTAMEFLMADPVLERIPERLERLEEHCRENFNRMALYHHYLSLAENNYRQYVENGNDPTLNRQFYILFATARAQHIRKTNDFPPVNVWEFLDKQRHLPAEFEDSLRYTAEMKESGSADTEADDISGGWFHDEHVAEMEPTDERIPSPESEHINGVIKAAIANHEQTY